MRGPHSHALRFVSLSMLEGIAGASEEELHQRLGGVVEDVVQISRGLSPQYGDLDCRMLPPGDSSVGEPLFCANSPSGNRWCSPRAFCLKVGVVACGSHGPGRRGTGGSGVGGSCLWGGRCCGHSSLPCWPGAPSQSAFSPVDAHRCCSCLRTRTSSGRGVHCQQRVRMYSLARQKSR